MEIIEGMNCAFTGTIVGDPVLKMVKNGTLALLTLTVVFAESNGTAITRVNRFGDQAKELSEILACSRMVQVEGIVTLNTRIRDGVPSRDSALPLAASPRRVNEARIRGPD